jgi:hypothetical protein
MKFDDHGWQDECSKSRLGRPRAKQSPLPWEEDVPCQQLVWTGRGASFWRVYLNLGEGFSSDLIIVDSDLNQNPTPISNGRPIKVFGGVNANSNISDVFARTSSEAASALIE